jgi:hypothetical protein
MLTFASLIQSKLFTFYVGEEEKPVVVHAAAIAATGQYFDALINGGMKESEEGSAKLADVQFDDFMRFCEYAYRGDYTAPLPADDDETVGIDISIELLAHARLYCFASIRLIEPLQDLALEKLSIALCTSDKLLSSRSKCPFFMEGYLSLARYVYSDASNLPERTNFEDIDELRDRVVENIVNNIEEIDGTDEFKALMKEGGEFVWDFWVAVKVAHDIV